MNNAQLSETSFIAVYGQSGFVCRNFRESPGQICIICHKQTSFQFFLIKCLYARMVVLFTF